jgi:hypothetical protein
MHESIPHDPEALGSHVQQILQSVKFHTLDRLDRLPQAIINIIDPETRILRTSQGDRLLNLSGFVDTKYVPSLPVPPDLFFPNHFVVVDLDYPKGKVDFSSTNETENERLFRAVHLDYGDSWAQDRELNSFSIQSANTYKDTGEHLVRIVEGQLNNEGRCYNIADRRMLLTPFGELKFDDSLFPLSKESGIVYIYSDQPGIIPDGGRIIHGHVGLVLDYDGLKDRPVIPLDTWGPNPDNYSALLPLQYKKAVPMGSRPDEKLQLFNYLVNQFPPDESLGKLFPPPNFDLI